MYVDTLRIENLRTFRTTEIALLHPARSQKELCETYPTISEVLYPNINLILGNNGTGKSTFLKALALACLGPVVSSVNPDRLVRREPKAPRATKRKIKTVKGALADLPSTRAIVKGIFVPNAQDCMPKSIKQVQSVIRIDRTESFEEARYLARVKTPSGKRVPRAPKEWHPIYSAESDAMFFVGYGANRRSEDKERFDPSARKSASHARARRVMSLFDETYSLVPFAAWLPSLAANNKGRFTQVIRLLKAIVGDDHWTFTGEVEAGEYLFQRGDQLVPFPALSDGYRAFYGWLSDLLYHVCMTASRGKKLVDNSGIVMIDEIDLHLHPSWQMEVLPRLSTQLPNIQFIVTSHSPLVVGSIQWVNLIILTPGDGQSSTLERREIPVHGLDADQVLVTPFFGLDSSRSDAQSVHLKNLSTLAGEGDRKAASQLLRELSQGSEAAKPRRPAAAASTKS
jgi:energy-coupling factor transporter ATP-binding protein EcfA2